MRKKLLFVFFFCIIIIGMVGCAKKQTPTDLISVETIQVDSIDEEVYESINIEDITE